MKKNERTKKNEKKETYLRVLLLGEVPNDVVPLRVLLAEDVEEERVDVGIEGLVVLLFLI